MLSRKRRERNLKPVTYGISQIEKQHQTRKMRRLAKEAAAWLFATCTVAGCLVMFLVAAGTKIAGL